MNSYNLTQIVGAELGHFIQKSLPPFQWATKEKKRWESDYHLHGQTLSTVTPSAFWCWHRWSHHQLKETARPWPIPCWNICLHRRDPHTKQNIDRIEAVKRQAAWFVVNFYHSAPSVQEIIGNLGWSFLQRCRTRSCQTLPAVQNSAWPSHHWQLQAEPSSPLTGKGHSNSLPRSSAALCIVIHFPCHYNGLAWPARQHSNRKSGNICVKSAIVTSKHKLFFSCIVFFPVVSWQNTQLVNCGHSLQEEGYFGWLLMKAAECQVQK